MTLHVHEKREITFAEFGALLGTRALLAGSHMQPSCTHFAEPHTHRFNMQVQGEQSECGTVSCIGGTMAFIMGKDPRQYVGLNGHIGEGPFAASRSFQTLFYPPEHPTRNWNDWITPAVAVAAIDNWLSTGKPSWDALYRRRAAINKAKA